jgi:hypothetical protein
MPHAVRRSARKHTVPGPEQDMRKILFDPETGQLAVRRPSAADRDAVIVDSIATEGFFADATIAGKSHARAGSVSA